MTAETGNRLPNSGVALIDQTLLCEAARLLRGDEQPGDGDMPPDFAMGRDWWPTTNAERLCHLATLLDSLLLYDVLYVLPAELPPDAENLPLRQMLIKTKVVRMLDVTPLAPQIEEDFTQLVKPFSPDDQAHVNDSGNEVICDTVHRMLTVKPARSRAYRTPRALQWGAPWRARTSTRDYVRKIVFEGMVREYEGTLSHWWLDSDELRRNVLAELAKHLVAKISYFSSGAVRSGVSHLRTFVYWRVAEHAGVPLVPSWRRLPQFVVIAEHLRRSLPQQVSAAVARAHRSTVDEVVEDVQPRLPPALALFLDQLKRKDAYTVIMALRDEWKPLRVAARDLAERLAGSSSMAKRLAAKRHFQSAINQLTAHTKYRTSSRLEQAIGYAPDVLSSTLSLFR